MISKELYERVLDLRNRISLDGDDTIYEEDYLLLDEVLDLIENSVGIKFKKQEKLLELYKQAYDNANAEVLKMFTYEQDEKTTLTNVIGHLDNSETVVKIRELENEV